MYLLSHYYLCLAIHQRTPKRSLQKDQGHFTLELHGQFHGAHDLVDLQDVVLKRIQEELIKPLDPDVFLVPWRITMFS